MRFSKAQLAWGLLILVLAAWTIDSFYSQYQFHMLSHREKLQSLWEADAKKLEESKVVPPGWYKLREIDYFGGDPTAKNWIIEGLRAPHPVSKEGTHKLEVLLLSFEDEGRDGAIIQYNLVHLKSNNMEWELGRTFFLSGGQSEWDEWVESNSEKIKKMVKAKSESRSKQATATNKTPPQPPVNDAEKAPAQKGESPSAPKSK